LFGRLRELAASSSARQHLDGSFCSFCGFCFCGKAVGLRRESKKESRAFVLTFRPDRQCPGASAQLALTKLRTNSKRDVISSRALNAAKWRALFILVISAREQDYSRTV
jgi:hypothetical protein